MDEIFLNLFLPLALSFIMFSLGLSLTVDDFKKVWASPKALMVGLVNQMILLPIVAVLIAQMFGLPPVLSVGVLILALCPGGVTTNVMSKIVNGNPALSISLTTIVTATSVVTMPLVIAFGTYILLGEAAPQFNIISVSATVFLVTVLPVMFGMYVAALFTRSIQAVRGVLFVVTIIAFFAIIFGALAANWDLFLLNLPRLGPTLIFLNFAMILIGIASARLFRLPMRDATTIGIETGVQNATIGITVAGIIASGQGAIPPESMPSAMYGVTMYLVTLPYLVVAYSANRRTS